MKILHGMPVIMMVVLVLSANLGMSCSARADEPVIEFVEVDAGDRAGEYLAALESVLASMKAARPEMSSRVFRAGYAGRNTGAIFVFNEFPSLEYFAASLKVFEEDAAYQHGLAGLRETGRVIRGESILFDVTPGREEND